MVIALHNLDEVGGSNQPVEGGPERLCAIAAWNLAHQKRRGLHALEILTPEPKVTVSCMLAPPALEMLTPSFVDQGDRWEFGQDFVVQVDNGLVRTCLDTGSLANRFRDQLALLRLTPSVDKFRRN
ncbi:hypothetical protein AN459_29715 [Pseudomonas aeruginosa]|nr:hypothetical protein AN459_29715 [Pseudomonas aeruginosa]OHW57300.1 hypothetical protein ABI36_0219210 [Pseudomonas aeruginosa]